MLAKKKTIGNFGEELACNFLTKRGYRIVGRNERVGHRELDIIAAASGKTIFVEVKTLAGANASPAENALSRSQIETIKKAIHVYCWKNKIKGSNVRLDFVCININKFTKTAKLKHYADIS
jgi:putative endonuclease